MGILGKLVLGSLENPVMVSVLTETSNVHPEELGALRGSP